MSRIRRNRRNNLDRQQHAYQSLELRVLLAGLTSDAIGYEPVMISDPFAFQAVSTADMIARAQEHRFMPGELVVAVKLPVNKTDASAVLDTFNWSQLTGGGHVNEFNTLMTVDRGDYFSVSLVQLDLGSDADIFAAMENLEGVVQWSSPNFMSDIDPREFIPNDPLYGQQYHHPLISNEGAWDITLGDSSILVGITDDGIDLDHVDLQNNIWINPGEIPGNGIDDDSNGYIDDVNGWDFINGNNDPNPEGGNDHGTHVAGIAAGDTDNNVGIAGTAGESTILPLQWYNGSWTAATNAEAFAYATDNGANIVSTSYNIDGWVGDPVFTAGLQYLYDGGVLHFNSAGNGNTNNSPRIAFHQTLLVVSTTSSDTRSSFSNYGTGTDISAPGSDIYSTVLNNNYGFKSGTSMAAPNAAGVAALVWAANPTWNREQVAAQVLASADNIDSLNPGFEGLLGAGRVNSFNALTLDIGAPQVDFVSGLPEDGTFLDDTTIDQFQLGFDQIMDPASVNNHANFDLRAAGPDDIFGNDDDIVYNLDAPAYMIGANEISFDIVDGPMNYGHYQFTVSQALQNPFADPLDGDGNGTGGDAYVQEFYISPPTIGNVEFHRNTYQVQDLVEINLGDANAFKPVMVQITTTGGDIETITLTDQGAGNYIGMIATSAGSISAEDGVIQVALGDEITVTYMDPDDGNGNPVEVSDTATISNVLEYESDDVPISITSNQTFTSEIHISDSGTVSDLDVQLYITHTFDADLDVFLIAPDNTRVELFTDVGGSGNNFDNTILDDEAALSINQGSAPFVGSYRPEGNLANFDSSSITGTWTLEITDDAGGDVGTLHAWSLFIDVVPATIDVQPDSLNFVRGIQFGGDLSDLLASDDSYLEGRPGITLNSTEPPVWIELTGTSPSLTPIGISFVVESRVNTSSINQTITAFDYDTNQFETIDARITSQTDMTAQIALGGDLSRFVNDANGEMKARIGYLASGPVLQFPWTISVDKAGWIVEPGGAAPIPPGGGESELETNGLINLGHLVVVTPEFQRPLTSSHSTVDPAILDLTRQLDFVSPAAALPLIAEGSQSLDPTERDHVFADFRFESGNDLDDLFDIEFPADLISSNG